MDIHYNEERNHQGIDNQLINPRPGSVVPVGDPQAVESQAEIARTGRLEDMLYFYYKKASQFKKPLRNLFTWIFEMGFLFTPVGLRDI